MGKALFDTKRAYSLYLEGKSYSQIAREVGSTAGSISYYARKYWAEDPPQEGERPDGTEERKPDEGSDPDTGQQRTGQPDVVSDAGTEAHDDHPASEYRRSEGNQKMNLYEVLEAATQERSGIWAICTAEAISSLWSWKSEADLLKAKAAIEYMLQKMEGGDGKV